MHIAVYPGTFDPVTHGHLDLANRARRHFDRLIVAILHNGDKEPLFDIDERRAMLVEAVKDWDNVEIDSFDGLLVDYARDRQASVILRGLRAVSDFEYEMQMTLMNRKLEPALETVFLMPSEQWSYVSSRLVREIAGLGGNIDDLVPGHVRDALIARLRS